MEIKINDNVVVQSPLIRCKLLGTVINIQGTTYTIRLPFPIKGEQYIQIERNGANILPIKEKKKQKTENKQMKKASSTIVSRLETIATMKETRQEQRTHNRTERTVKNDIHGSSNWLDYMQENGIE